MPGQTAAATPDDDAEQAVQQKQAPSLPGASAAHGEDDIEAAVDDAVGAEDENERQHRRAGRRKAVMPNRIDRTPRNASAHQLSARTAFLASETPQSELYRAMMHLGWHVRGKVDVRKVPSVKPAGVDDRQVPSS